MGGWVGGWVAGGVGDLGNKFRFEHKFTFWHFTQHNF